MFKPQRILVISAIALLVGSLHARPVDMTEPKRSSDVSPRPQRIIHSNRSNPQYAGKEMDTLVLARSIFDGGGIMLSVGGGIQLAGTVGQPDSAVAEAGDIQLTGGFWFELPLGDCENDGDVDLHDHARFADCLSSPDPSIVFPKGCGCFDINRNGTVDLRDFATVQANFHAFGD